MTEDERKMDGILKKDSPFDSDEDRRSHDRVLQRLGEAIKAQGLEERALWGGRGKPLAEFEQLVMAATLELRGEVEVPGITARVNESLAKPSGPTAVFFTLNRLEGEGLISSRYSPNRYFEVTEEGKRALAAAKAQANAAAEEGINPLGDFA